MMDRTSPTPDLEAAVEEFYKNFPYPDSSTFALEFHRHFQDHCIKKFRRVVCDELGEQIAACVGVMYSYEAPKLTFERQTHTDVVDHARYRDLLLAILKFKDKYHILRLADFKRLLTAMFEPLIAALPPSVCITAAGYPQADRLVPLPSVLDNPKATMDAMLAPLMEALERDRSWDEGVMGAITAMHIERNIKERKPPIEHSPFTYIFEAQIPAPPEEPEEEPGEPVIAENNWYAHCVLLAMTRFGKTNAIAWRIMQLLPQIAVGRASLIVMEPKGVLTEDLLHLADVWNMRDRVVIIDPSDTSVSVNLFESLGSVNETISRVIRVMNTLTSNLTDLQRDTLIFAIRAMYTLPSEPSLRLLMDILRKGKEALEIGRLSGALRDFFEYDFQPSDARFVIARLRGLLANSVFESLFAADRTTFDMLTEIQAGKLILIKATGKALAGEVKLYGRFWIEQVNKCIWPRLDMPEERRTPTTFILDEAQNYIADDEHISQMLDQAAESKIGLLFAMHHMAQIDDDHVRHSIYTNTAIKFSARTSADIHALSGAMGDREGLPKLLPNLPRFHFYMFNPDLTYPIKVKFPLVDFKQMPRIHSEQYDELLKQNRERLGYHPTQPSANTAEKVAALSPIAAILETRRIFEDGVRQIFSTLPNANQSTTLLEMIHSLQDNNVIGVEVSDMLHKLRIFGNKAAHDANATDSTTEKAIEFRAAVDYVIALLQSTKSQSHETSEGSTGWR